MAVTPGRHAVTLPQPGGLGQRRGRSAVGIGRIDLTAVERIDSAGLALVSLDRDPGQHLVVKRAHREAEVVIYEKSQKVLAKVKISGGGRCNVTNATFDTNVESSLTIIGSKGNVKVGGQYMEKLDFINMESEFDIPVFDRVTSANQYNYYRGSADKHDVFLQSVIECLKNDLPPEIGLEDELNVIHFIEQAMKPVVLKNY